MGNGFNFDSLLDALADRVAARLRAELGQDGAASTVKPRLLTVEQAAEYLGYTPAAIRHMVAKGPLPAVRIGRSVRFDPADLDRFIAEHKG